MKNRNLEHKNDWRTPKDFYDKLDSIYHFDFDPCPFCHNMSWNGLEVEWGKMNFVNPPYSLKEKEAFIRKAFSEYEKGRKSVLLLPVSTSTKIFHELIYQKVEIGFLKGRLKFSGWNKDGEWVENKTGQHDSMLVFLT